MRGGVPWRIRLLALERLVAYRVADWPVVRLYVFEARALEERMALLEKRIAAGDELVRALREANPGYDAFLRDLEHPASTLRLVDDPDGAA